MSKLSAVPTPPVVTVAELNARADRILPQIAAGAAQRERDRQLPYEAVAQIAQAGLFTVRIPKRFGGAGGSVKDVIALLIRIASADSNVAQALRPGFGFVEGLLASRAEGAEEERERWFGRYLQGAVIGNAGWEVGGANGSISARIVRDGEHFRACGSKYYSTGSLYADWVSAVALDENDQPVSFILPRDRQGLELLDDFDAMGQRLTASGTTHLHDVQVLASEIRTRTVEEGKRTIVTPFLQVFLAAVQAGIARNALNDAVTFAKEHARPIKHSSATRSVDDPYVELSVGDVSARAFTAEAVVLHAADSIDRAWAADLDAVAVDQAAVDVAQAQYIAAESALKAAELVFDVGGASTTGRAHNLDRHWRNARTVANHNPRHWKAAAVGAWQLKGTPPPTSGLF
ncbi:MULTISPECIES: acyl-CoA dehydrogenase family protein [unclassified Pseudomonas]|jgi:alkylation response protein AidB-like acyl-CoA dehydrogenase|uniref:acyl-CoA dehydrogenase family protein n=1 Tax=unclassified Pseudomonas TaxID=196821 RepID=UPI000272BB0A|nr:MULTISPECIES: acyl-CoA dehydrogenase family protein [unclassified Pseudomonas]MDP9060779.1 acyl-CoA dehydrogenase family protein [Pseudomonadota bacterium]EJF73507.1 acyl-CoA dehydrogenase [Pseudomonas sp. Ag1]MBT1266336.1 acyl-CoA dehydrogenase family protein [Pseudomonas sp. VS38]MDE1912405.1 acyl-CoA dehydrogenase family protein [Pseudomonas sp.]MDE2194075.1 acyl-CoA dehydrogenase family protein [Pseudomonas sp.]|eukprot:gene9914-11581_t